MWKQIYKILFLTSFFYHYILFALHRQFLNFVFIETLDTFARGVLHRFVTWEMFPCYPQQCKGALTTVSLLTSFSKRYHIYKFCSPARLPSPPLCLLLLSTRFALAFVFPHSLYLLADVSLSSHQPETHLWTSLKYKEKRLNSWI